MVAPVKNFDALVQLYAAKKAAFYFLRQNNFLIENVVLASCPAPVIPKDCWIIKAKGRLAYFSGKAEEIEVLIVFSSREKALQCMDITGLSPEENMVISLTWSCLVKEFRQHYNFVIVDDIGLHKQCTIIPINA